MWTNYSCLIFVVFESGHWHGSDLCDFQFGLQRLLQHGRKIDGIPRFLFCENCGIDVFHASLLDYAQENGLGNSRDNGKEWEYRLFRFGEKNDHGAGCTDVAGGDGGGRRGLSGFVPGRGNPDGRN